MNKYEVKAEQLHWSCDPEQFAFECAEDIEPLQDFIGQDRALSAMEFGLAIARPGYNIYVAGLTGTGKSTIMKAYIQKNIQERQAKEGLFRPDDWCYLYNFADPDRPTIVRLAQGNGKSFKGQVGSLLQRLREELSKAFSSRPLPARSWSRRTRGSLLPTWSTWRWARTRRRPWRRFRTNFWQGGGRLREGQGD